MKKWKDLDKNSKSHMLNWVDYNRMLTLKYLPEDQYKYNNYNISKFYFIISFINPLLATFESRGKLFIKNSWKSTGNEACTS